MAEQGPVTATVFVETSALEVGTLADDDALKAFIEDNKTKIKPDTAEIVGRKHVIGSGVTYDFRADHK